MLLHSYSIFDVITWLREAVQCYAAASPLIDPDCNDEPTSILQAMVARDLEGLTSSRRTTQPPFGHEMIATIASVHCCNTFCGALWRHGQRLPTTTQTPRSGALVANITSCCSVIDIQHSWNSIAKPRINNKAVRRTMLRTTAKPWKPLGG